MAPYFSHRSPQTRWLFGFVAASAVGHVAFLGLFVWLSGWGSAPKAPEMSVVKTRLVKLGKKRDERLLPRIDKAPKPPPPAPEPAPVVKPAAPPPKKAPKKPAPVKAKPKPAKKPAKAAKKNRPKRSASDILSQFKDKNEEQDLESLIEKTIGKSTPEGHEDGHKIGTEITGRLKAEYNDLLGQKIRSLYELPDTISDEERVRLEGFLFLQVGAGGQLLDVKVDKTSGNTAFDNAMVAAAKKAAPFPPPPIPLRAFYSTGVVFRFRP